MRFHFIALCCLLCSVCYAKSDSTYVYTYPQKWSIKGYTSRDFLFMLQETGKDNEKLYMPNNPQSFGIGFSWRNFALNLGSGFDFMTSKKLGKTKSLDLQLHNYGRMIVFDLFFQRYHGFYSENDIEKYVTICPDLKINKYAGYGQYIFNHRKYSYNAAFNQRRKQLKSAGSFLLGGGVYYTEINSDSSFVYNDKNSHSCFQVGVSAGYAYTWVLSPRWFISASATAGINLGKEKTKESGKEKLQIYPTAFPRFSVGYSHDKWAIGFNFVDNMLFTSFSDETESSLNIFSGNAQLYFIRRFDITRPFNKKKKL